jgi:hypothetical protein
LSGNVTDSTASEISIPEFSGELEKNESRSSEHEPVAHGMSFAKIVEGKPIDNQKQKAGCDHEQIIYVQHNYPLY